MEKLAIGVVAIILILLFLKNRKEAKAKKTIIAPIYRNGVLVVPDTNKNNLVSTD